MSRRTVTWAALAASAALVSAGCSWLEGDDPRDDAEAFATALARAQLSRVGFTDQRPAAAQRWWEDTRAGMGEAKHAVDVTAVQTDGDTARARLAHTWTFDRPRPVWSYRTTVRLVREGDTWQVDLEPGAVAPGLKKGESLELSTVPAERGDILGAGGRALVTERPVLRFGIDKAQVPADAQAASARALAELLRIDVDSFVTSVEAAGDEAFVEAIVLRTEDATARVRNGAERIEGARALEDEIPLAPTREFARALLGGVGPVTAEMVEESDGAYQAGDVAGTSGLEQRYDEQLRGLPGLVVEAVEETGEREPRVLFETEPRAGEPLRTTLEVQAQLAAERALRDVGPPSAVVAIRPSTGAVVAAANGPGSEGYATGTVGRYAPGSTFKVVTSLALLRSGMSPQEQMSCPRTTVVDGKQFKNYSDYPSGALGEIPLRTAIAQSCNTALIRERDRVSPTELVEAAAALGLGEDHDVGFPAYFGSVPQAGSATGQAAAMIGQGQVLASPLAMAAVAGSVASGETVVPRLLDSVDVSASPAEPLTADEATQLRRLMAAVVQEGSGTFLADVPGDQVLAKTGTAEFGDAEPLDTHAWMIAARGDLAVAVFVERGESGSQTAGPVLEAFLRAVRG